MHYYRWLAAAVLISAAGFSIQAQPGKDVPELKGIPARATPGDYQFQAKAGEFTVAAEFTGHSLPTDQGPLTNQEYVGVEAALFGPAGAKLKISIGDFSLRINKKKMAESVPYGMTFSSLKDPEWTPPEGDPSSKKSKSSIGSGGQGNSNEPPPPVKIPIEVQRNMAHRIQRAALPEGDRELPQAGLIFFQYRGKTENIESLELIYEGPAGKATLKFQ
jgi:hypothetical protein